MKCVLRAGAAVALSAAAVVGTTATPASAQEEPTPMTCGQAHYDPWIVARAYVECWTGDVPGYAYVWGSCGQGDGVQNSAIMGAFAYAKINVVCWDAATITNVSRSFYETV